MSSADWAGWLGWLAGQLLELGAAGAAPRGSWSMRRLLLYGCQAGGLLPDHPTPPPATPPSCTARQPPTWRQAGVYGSQVHGMLHHPAVAWDAQRLGIHLQHTRGSSREDTWDR